jgi:hypothetical protein
MFKRILPISVVLICIAWSVFVSIELLSNENSIDFKHYFNELDQQVLVVHQENELDWNASSIQILPSNQTIAIFLLSRTNQSTSLFVSSKRALFVMEKKDNWSKKSVEKLLTNGLFNFEFTGRRSFKFGSLNGEFKNNQLALYQGELTISAFKFPTVDSKSSYSIIDLKEKEPVVTDIYQKADKTLSYKRTKLLNSKAKLCDDKLLYSSVISANFTSYTFYENNYFSETDATFRKSDFKKWIKNGIVFLSNGSAELAIFDFKEGQNPVQNLNDQFGLPEKNEAFGEYKNVSFCDAWKLDTTSKFYVVESEGICLVGRNKAYLDEVLTEMSLGKTLSQNQEKIQQVFSTLPRKVIYRNVTTTKSVAKSILNKTLIETTCINKDNAGLTNIKDEKVKDYFSMNPGERILNFVTFNGRGNVVLLTETNKLVGYSNGSKRWEKQLTEIPSAFSIFSFQNSTFSLCTSAETQILDLNGRIIYRFKPVSSVAPSSLQVENKEVYFVGDGIDNVSVFNTAGKTLKVLRLSESVKGIYSYTQNGKAYCVSVGKTTAYISEIVKRKSTKTLNIDSTTQVFPFANAVYFGSVNNGTLTLQQTSGARKSIRLNQEASLMGAFSQNNQVYFLIKQGKNLKAIDFNGQKLWEHTLVLEEISAVHIAVNQSGKTILGILDAIENQLYLYDTKGNKIDESERHGEQKIEISPFGANAFSITTYLGSYLIQYTKQ